MHVQSSTPYLDFLRLAVESLANGHKEFCMPRIQSVCLGYVLSLGSLLLVGCETANSAVEKAVPPVKVEVASPTEKAVNISTRPNYVRSITRDVSFPSVVRPIYSAAPRDNR